MCICKPILYQAVNDRDLQTALTFVSPDIVYEDLTFPKPFVGKQAVEDFLKEICDGFPTELKFVIEKEVSDQVKTLS